MEDVQVREERIRRLDVTTEWASYRQQQSFEFNSKFEKMIKSQELALSELQLESPERYEQAVQVGAAGLEVIVRCESRCIEVGVYRVRGHCVLCS